MVLNHVGIINENARQAERFYGDFLKFDKTREFVVPPDLSDQLFRLSREITVMVFERDGIKLEVFLCPDCRRPAIDLAHLGLHVDDLSSLIEQAHASGVDHIIGSTAGKTVHFIRDFSGNLIEVKQK